MGYYINPQDGSSKEQWLKDNGVPIPETVVRAQFSFLGTHLPICFVENPMFSVAAIAYDLREVEAFLRFDRRVKTWYLVPKDKLKPWYKSA